MINRTNTPTPTAIVEMQAEKVRYLLTAGRDRMDGRNSRATNMKNAGRTTIAPIVKKLGQIPPRKIRADVRKQPSADSSRNLVIGFFLISVVASLTS